LGATSTAAGPRRRQPALAPPVSWTAAFGPLPRPTMRRMRTACSAQASAPPPFRLAKVHLFAGFAGGRTRSLNTYPLRRFAGLTNAAAAFVCWTHCWFYSLSYNRNGSHADFKPFGRTLCLFYASVIWLFLGMSILAIVVAIKRHAYIFDFRHRSVVEMPLRLLFISYHLYIEVRTFATIHKLLYI